MYAESPFVSHSSRPWFNRLRRRLRSSPLGGSGRRFAFTTTKAPGTPTPATATTGDFNSFSLLGVPWEVPGYPTWHRRVNSSTGRGSSITATDAVGVSGAHEGLAGSPELWGDWEWE